MRIPKRSLAALALLLSLPLFAGPKESKTKQEPPAPPPLLLSGGRKLTYERSVSSQKETRQRLGFWSKVLDIVAGQPEIHALTRPYSVVTDSKGRIIVTDPGQGAVHIFDLEHQKYKFISRDDGRDAMLSPQCVAVDAADNIYVTDSDTGKIFVFDSDGKFKRALGSLKGGEGFFKRPTGIAVDSAAQRIYVTDTARHQIFVLDMNGGVVGTIGRRGSDPGQFNFPTELRLTPDGLLVVDAMNFRVQAFDKSGTFQWQLGQVGESTGRMFRPKGVALDSERNVYVVDGMFDTVQVFGKDGRILYYFGGSGDGPAEFQLPAGLFIDQNDRIYVVDSYNRRIEIFRYSGAPK